MLQKVSVINGKRPALTESLEELILETNTGLTLINQYGYVDREITVQLTAASDVSQAAFDCNLAILPFFNFNMFQLLSIIVILLFKIPFINLKISLFLS